MRVSVRIMQKTIWMHAVSVRMIQNKSIWIHAFVCQNDAKTFWIHAVSVRMRQQTILIHTVWSIKQYESYGFYRNGVNSYGFGSDIIISTALVHIIILVMFITPIMFIIVITIIITVILLSIIVIMVACQNVAKHIGFCQNDANNNANSWCFCQNDAKTIANLCDFC